MGAARPTRAQGAFIADSEIQALVAWWKTQGRPVYDQDVLRAEAGSVEASGDEDALLADVARLIVRAGYGSVSLLQRKMKIGYVRAARIVDQLEEKGIVGPAQGRCVGHEHGYADRYRGPGRSRGAALGDPWTAGCGANQ